MRQHLIPAALLMFLLAGCGLPPDKKALANKARANVEVVLPKAVADLRRGIDALLRSGGEPATYVGARGWTTRLSDIAREAETLRGAYDGQVAPLLAKDSSSDAAAIGAAAGEVERRSTALATQASVLANEITAVRRAFEDGPRLQAQLDAEARALLAVLPRVEAASTAAQGSFPERLLDIESRAQAVAAAASQASQQAEHGRQLWLAATPGSPDRDHTAAMRAMAGGSQAVKEASDRVQALLAAMAGLGAGRAVTLTDMRMDCHVTISRTSWDETSDDNTERNFTFPPVRLPCEDAERLEVHGENSPLARWSRGFTPVPVKGWEAVWAKLALPARDGMPSSHDTAEFYLEDVTEKYFHRTTVNDSGTVTDTGWREVTPEVFEARADDLGMDIESKRPGEFPDEASTHAAPPGMAFVGDARYGQWQEDPEEEQQQEAPRPGSGGGHHGRSHIWIWNSHSPYGHYYGASGSSRGIRTAQFAEWGQVRHSQPYHGSLSPQAPRAFGTEGTVTRSSSAGKAATWTEGSSRVPSIRGAGPANRGGGPGGGGK